MFVTVVVVAIVVSICRTVEDKAVVVPMVLSADTGLDVVANGTVSVVVEIDSGSFPLPPSVTHSAIMAPMNTNANSARHNTFLKILIQLNFNLAYLFLTSMPDV